MTPTQLIEAVYSAISGRDYEAGFALLADDFQ